MKKKSTYQYSSEEKRLRTGRVDSPSSSGEPEGKGRRGHTSKRNKNRKSPKSHVKVNPRKERHHLFIILHE